MSKKIALNTIKICKDKIKTKNEIKKKK